MNNDILCFEGQTNRRTDGRTDVLHMPNLIGGWFAVLCKNERIANVISFTYFTAFMITDWTGPIMIISLFLFSHFYFFVYSVWC